MRKLVKVLTPLSLALATALLATVVAINLSIAGASSDKSTGEIAEVEPKQTALVLGALVYSDGTPSAMLQDRIDSAAELYKTGKVKKVLVSGDHGRKEYDEVNTMRDQLLKQGVSPKDLFTDHAGFDTYDSLYRAKHVFEADSLVVVTQEFHLPRVLYTAQKLGIDAEGLVADRQEYGSQTQSSQLREYFARVKAFKDVKLDAKPKFLGPKIPITGNGQSSWDS